MNRVTKTLNWILLIISIVVCAGITYGVSMWAWIAAYWLVLAFSNLTVIKEG